MKTTKISILLLALSLNFVACSSSDDAVENPSDTEQPGGEEPENLIVDIPDANFKKLLVNNIEINTNGDEEIQKTEAASYKGGISSIFETGRDIKNITGIEYFTNITEIYLEGYSLESVDFSKNTALHSLEIREGLLTSIDLSMNTKLDYLDLENNQLSSIDISNSSQLNSLYLGGNNLTTIDVSNNSLLDELILFENELTTIDVSSNINLEVLNLTNNKLSSINISTNTNLVSLLLNKNQLITIDASVNSKLQRLNISENKLFSAFVNNGNNNNIILFDLTNNPNLSCIQVDTPLPFNLQNNTKWKKDNNTLFSTNCRD